jgi:hypothetical protein
MLARAREGYWNHVEQHGCRRTIAAESGGAERATGQSAVAGQVHSSSRTATYR